MKCENCSKLNQNTDEANKKELKGFIKKQAIAKLPETLALQIQRNSWSDQNFEMIKQTNYVQFPLNIKIDSTIKSQLIAPSGRVGCQKQSNLNLVSTLGNRADLNSSFSLKQVGLGGLLGGNNKNSITNTQKSNNSINAIQSTGTQNSQQQYYDLR